MRAIFAGTFDPPTLGHWDVVESTAPLFEKFYIVVANNTSKKTLLDPKARVELLKKIIASSKFKNKCEVILAPGLVADLCKELNVDYLVRGVRTAADFERELPMSVANELLSKGVKTLLVPSTKENSFVSSSLVREIFFLGGDVRPFVSELAFKYLQSKHLQSKKGKKK